MLLNFQECSHCGDPLRPDSGHCGNCGEPVPPWPSEPAPRRRAGRVADGRPGTAPPAPVSAQARAATHARLALGLGLLLAATTGAAWLWSQQQAAPAAASGATLISAQPATGQAVASVAPVLSQSVPVPVPNSTPTPTPPSASASAPTATASSATVASLPVAAVAVAVAAVAAEPAAPLPATALPNAEQAKQFATAWFEAGARASDAQTMRRFYADTIAYYQRGEQSWRAVAADKAAYLRRWPQRSYQLDGVQLLRAAEGTPASDAVQVALNFHWRVERDGRWFRGQAVTVLALRRVGGELRVVMEREG